MLQQALRGGALSKQLVKIFDYQSMISLSPIEPHTTLDCSSPESPARDSRFTIVSSPPSRPKNAQLSEKVIADMHINLMSLEIPTIEACSRNICDFPDMSWEFVQDMASQIWDEVRHAESCYQRIEYYGGLIGSYPVDLEIWNMASGLDLPTRLAVHQRLGESIGVDAALWSVNDLIESGDPHTANLYRFIAADEINHVAIGNKWIRRLASSDLEVEEIHSSAVTRRAEMSGKVDGPRPFPFHAWAAQTAGFSEDEIEFMKRRSSEQILSSLDL
jgi:uncharacterized ferritin-like protein (DUF455 family)